VQAEDAAKIIQIYFYLSIVEAQPIFDASQSSASQNYPHFEQVECHENLFSNFTGFLL